MSLLKSTTFHHDERVVKICHPVWLTYFWSYFFSAIFILTPFFFMFFLFAKENWGMIVFFVSLLVGLGFLFRAIFLNYYNALVITTERLIGLTQFGAWNRQVSEINYAHVRQVSFQIKGLWRTLFKDALLKVETDGGQAALVFDGLRQPARVQELITSLRDAYHAAKTQSGSGLDRLTEQIQKLSAEDRQKLANLIGK